MIVAITREPVDLVFAAVVAGFLLCCCVAAARDRFDLRRDLWVQKAREDRARAHGAKLRAARRARCAR